MTETLGIASSALALAGTGFRIAELIDTIREAGQQFEPDADYVKLTSTIIERIGTYFRDEELRLVYTPRLLTATDEALQGCKNAFSRLHGYLDTILKDGQTTSKAKMSWPWKQKEFEALQTNLQRFKASLDLVLGALNFVSATKAENNTTSMKVELQRLMVVEKAAKDTEAASVMHSREIENVAVERAVVEKSWWNVSSGLTKTGETRDPVSAAARLRARLQRHSDRTVPDQEPLAKSSFGLSAALKQDAVLKPIAQPSTTGLDKDARLPAPAYSTSTLDPQRTASAPNDPLLRRLSECSEAVEKLSSTLKEVTARWNSLRQYEQRCLMPAFQTLQDAVEQLVIHEVLDLQLQTEQKSELSDPGLGDVKQLDKEVSESSPIMQPRMILSSSRIDIQRRESLPRDKEDSQDSSREGIPRTGSEIDPDPNATAMPNVVDIQQHGENDSDGLANTKSVKVVMASVPSGGLSDLWDNGASQTASVGDSVTRLSVTEEHVRYTSRLDSPDAIPPSSSRLADRYKGSDATRIDMRSTISSSKPAYGWTDKLTSRYGSLGKGGIGAPSTTAAIAYNDTAIPFTEQLSTKLTQKLGPETPDSSVPNIADVDELLRQWTTIDI